MTPRLFLNHSADLDWLAAVEFGRVHDGQPQENWRGVSEQFGYLTDGPDGPTVGFMISQFSTFDVNDPEVSGIWDGPRFDAPTAGLTNATAGEIVVAARRLFGRRNSINRFFFNLAIDAEGYEAVQHWFACVQMGDSMAHFGLGYTLYELGHFRHAYAHLRYYTEVSPAVSWNWCWLGKAAEAIGEAEEAARAYERAIELEAVDGQQTEARELLARLAQTRLGTGSRSPRGTAVPIAQPSASDVLQRRPPSRDGAP